MGEDLELQFRLDGTDEAAAGVQKVEKQAEGLASELTGPLKASAEQAYAAFEKLSNVQGVRGLQKGIVEATLAMEDFKAKADAAAAAGQKIPAGVSPAMKAMQGDIDAASVKLGKARDVMGDVATRANAAGQSFEYLRGAGGGVGGMLNALESSSSGALSSLGKLGIASLGIAGVFATAVGAGKLLGEAITAIAAKNQLLVDTQAKARAASELHVAAMRALDAGLIANSDSVKGLIQNYENLILSQGRGSAAAKQAAADFAGVGDALKKYADETQKAETLGALLEGAFKRSGAEGVEMARLMEGALRTIETRYRAFGDAVPAGIRLAIDALDKLDASNKRVMASAQEAAKKMQDLPAAMRAQVDAAERLAAADRLVADSHDKLIPALAKILDELRTHKISFAEATAGLTAYATANKLTVEEVMKMAVQQGNLQEALTATDTAFAAQIGPLADAAAKMGTFAERTREAADALRAMNAEADKNTSFIKDRNAKIDAATEATSNFAEAQKNGIAIEGEARLLQIMTISATDAQNAALEKLLQTQNAYSDSVAKTLDVAKGWKDYLAILVDSYQSGATSLLAYRQALQMFETQLQQTFAGATGKAKDALEDMIHTIEKLIATAGAGGVPSGDQSPTGALKRAFGG